MDDLFRVVSGIFSSLEEFHDCYTKYHEERVSKLMFILASNCGYDENQCKNLSMIGVLHDIGKIAIPASILEKTAPLNKFERKVIELHPIMGKKFLKSLNHPLKDMAENIVFYHHENFDGSGYPVGLKGDAIPLEARICAICDVYDALKSVRPYNKNYTHDEVIEMMFNKDKDKNGLYYKFDPELLKVFEKISSEFSEIN